MHINVGVPTDADREYLRKLLYSLADTMVEDEHVLGKHSPAFTVYTLLWV